MAAKAAVTANPIVTFDILVVTTVDWFCAHVETDEVQCRMTCDILRCRTGTIWSKFASTQGLVLRSERQHAHVRGDNVMLDLHAKCKVERTRGVDGRERWQAGRGGRGIGRDKK